MNTKKLILITILLTALVLGSASYFIISAKESDYSSRQTSTSQTDIELPSQYENEADSDFTELMGFGQLTISKSNPCVNLINPDSNDVYLSFDVFYKDELLYQSDLIEPGKMEQVNVYDKLDAGSYILTYSIGSYDFKTKEVYWTGIQQNQEILVKK